MIKKLIKNETIHELAKMTLDQSPMAIFWVDSEGKVCYPNKTACSYLGYSFDELISMRVWDFNVDYNDAAVFKKLWQKIKIKKLLSLEARHRRKDNVIIPVEIIIHFVEHDKEHYACAFVRDITEKKQYEEEIRRITYRDELILRSAGEGIYGLDLNGHTTFCNPAAAEMIGWQLEDLIGKFQHDILHHTQANGAPYSRERCPIYATLKDGKTHRVADEVFWRKDGTSFPVEYKSSPIVDKGELSGAVVVFRDITKQKDAEEALVNALSELKKLKNQLQMENAYLRQEISATQRFGDIIGESAALQNILRQIELVSPTDASVLILGESGTGKELVAREIHRRSHRCDRPLIKVNCASIPKELYESEFFGHIKGAFTGALQNRAGRFQAADGGTLFLDEVGEIPLELQSKLLRVLQDGQYERVGEERTRKVDVRIVAATNRDLKEDIKAGRFRQDLYFRLNVFPIEVISLRSRKEDIPVLATHFVNEFAKKMGRTNIQLTQANILELQRYDWPGNIRELQNVIERAIITAQSGKLYFNISSQIDMAISETDDTRNIGEFENIMKESQLKQLERESTLAALRKCNWKIYGLGGAAELLEIKPTTLVSRIKKMGLKKNHL